MKRICLCGSMSVLPRMLEIKSTLESNGMAVETLSLDEPKDFQFYRKWSVHQ